MSARRRVPLELLALALVVLASTIVRVALSRGVNAPWISPDEQLYGLLGRSLADGDGLTILGQPVPYYSLLYPALVGIPFLWSGVAAGVTGVQVLQALVMSTTAVPVYFWARPLAGSRFALLAAGLTVLIPGLAYSGLLMSETLYYLAATLAAWAVAACLREPTLRRQGLLLAAVGVALATRLQAVGFVAAVLVAVALLAAAERSTATLRRMLPTFAVLGALSVVWIGVRVALGGVGELIGAYAPLAEASTYSVADVAQSLAWETGGLVLLTVGIPLVALGVLTWGTLRGEESDPGVRALVATAVAYLSVTVLEVSAFASRFVEHVTERQLLSLAPPAFIAFAVWLRRGLPRPQPVTSILTLTLAAFVLLLPLDRVATPSAAADSLSTIPLERLKSSLGEGTFEVVYAVTAGLLLLLAVLVPRRLAPVLATLVALALAAGSVSASDAVRERSRKERESTFADAPRDWIDALGEKDVALLLTDDRVWPSAWHQLFWNRSISRVVRLVPTESPGVMPQDVVAVGKDGRLTTRTGAEVEASWVAAPAGVSLVGERVATLPPSFDQQGMAVWHVEGPIRIAQRVLGIRPDGDIHPGDTPVIRVYACGPGRLELTILGKQGLPTRVLRGGAVAAERAVAAGRVWRPRIPAPASADGSGVCTYRLETDGLIGSTRIEFVPGAEPRTG